MQHILCLLGQSDTHQSLKVECNKAPVAVVHLLCRPTQVSVYCKSIMDASPEKLCPLLTPTNLQYSFPACLWPHWLALLNSRSECVAVCWCQRVLSTRRGTQPSAAGESLLAGLYTKL